MCSVDYEELAVKLAEDSDRLYSMRTHLEQTRNSSAAFDTRRWVKNFETGLTGVWRRHETGQTPDHVEVEDNEPIFKTLDGQIL